MNVIENAVERRIGDLVSEAVKLQHATSRDEAPTGAPGFLGLSKLDLQRYSILNAIRAKRESIMRGASAFAPLSASSRWFNGLEYDCHKVLAKVLGEPEHQGRFYVPLDVLYRDLNAASASGGGYLVGSTTTGSFIDTLRARSVVFRLGAVRLPGQRENIALPRMATGSTVTWLSTETSTATEATPTTQQVAGSPKTAAAYVDISRLLDKQSNPAVDGVLTRVIASDLAAGIDVAVLDGSGSLGQPLGVRNTSGLNTVSGTSLAYTGLVSAQYEVANDNAILDPNSLGYVTTPAIAQTLKGRQRFTSTDSPLWAGAVHQGTIEGVTALSTKGMSSATMLFGDWSTVLIPEWGTLMIDVNPFADFQKGIIGIRALWSIDVLVTHPESFVSISSIT